MKIEHVLLNSLKLFVFILWQVEGYGNILKLSCRSLAFTSYYKAFLKNQKRSGTSLPALFSGWVLKKNIIFCWLTKFHCLVAFTLCKIFLLCNMCIIINCQPGCNTYFEINLIFLIKRFFVHDQKVKTKI